MLSEIKLDELFPSIQFSITDTIFLGQIEMLMEVVF